MNHYQDLIETIDHKVRLWVDLLTYGSQEIEIKDSENKITVKLQTHKNRQIVSIPSIEVHFAEKIGAEELANIGMNLLELLWESSLEDFCDFQITLDMDFINGGFTLNFNDYSIKKS